MSNDNWNDANSETTPQSHPAPQYGQPAYDAGAPVGSAPSYQESAYAAEAPALPQPLGLAIKLMFAGAVVSALASLSAIFQKSAIHDAIVKANNETSGKKLTASQIDSATTMTMVLSIVIGLIGAALWVLTAMLNKKGKKWARVMATVFCVISLLQLANALSGTLGPIQVVLAILIVLIGIASVVMLWRKENAPYYEFHSTRR